MTDRKSEAPLAQPTPPLDNAVYVRLHVTPLDAELLKVVLSSTLLPKARSISYHTIDTFPEKQYGFLELPFEDADKLRKKLNGAVLKGVKIRIEHARPSGIPAPLAEEAMAEEKIPQNAAEGLLPRKDKRKKRKRDGEELSGAVLKDDRKIKRGWTSADESKERRSKTDKEKKGKEKGKKKQAKSKYTDHAECLVKTVLPANAVPSTDADHSTATKKKKKGKSREVVVHEFERATKFPTFLKAVAPACQFGAPLEFVDGKGWVNEDGDVVETVKTRPPPSARVLLPGSRSEDRSHGTIPDEENTTSSSDEEPAGESGPKRPLPASHSSSVPESTESDASSPSSPAQSDPLRPRSAGSVRSLSIKIPPATPNESKVHPLEALYKRPKQPDGEIPNAAPSGSSFNFFADGNDESAEEDIDAGGGERSGIQVPLTPFSRQDLELRGIRSAAPTPDTAHPSRRFTPWEPEKNGGDQDDQEAASEDSEEDEQSPSNSPTAQGGEGDGKPASDFQKWFWENRGDLNRSWKKRRKLAGKEKRYRENKARMARAI
ncbi:hypothetical protein C8A00DRAFT_18964 [Chaetomidium leptoderma]|uniref:Uncharacterized protein n=1 Tax=Chaetomidium leptoderma TaxID=669021 RepID=A0AAN6ZSI7_9PEZI|nr:hypothetical protein C8A00DRAFT_18964 [Chaetomidium leptoderma]